MGDEARRRRFGSLYEEHLGTVARYAARRISSAEVHDVVAETFLVAWRRLEDVPEDALPWLLGTARRLVANRRRSATRRWALDAKVATETAAVRPYEAPAPEGIDARVLAAIASLPDAEREAFILVAWDGLAPARAAVAAGCTPGAFRMRLHRARSELRRLLESFEDVQTTLEGPR